jgi:hypothetical protein
MKNLLFISIFISLSLFITGCGASMKTYKDETPVFKPEEWFIGKFKATGGFFDRFGTLKRRFTMTLDGRREGELTILNEVLSYTDGEVSTREYKIKKISENYYEATAEGVVGKATIEASGNALRWRYQLKQKIGDSEWILSFDDWMYLVDEKTLIDRAQVSKFGINLGEVFLTSVKE